MKHFIIILIGLFAIAVMASPSHAAISGKESKNKQHPKKSFVDIILNKLPNTYIVSKTEYWKSFAEDPQKATLVKPCQGNNTDLASDTTYSPVCDTKLTILEEKEKTDNLGEYINKNDDLSSYKRATGAKLVHRTYQGNIPLVYTQKAFMCIGSGGDGCMRTMFAYHLKDGRNILAEISFMPYNKGKYVRKPIKEVQDIINIYKEALTK